MRRVALFVGGVDEDRIAGEVAASGDVLTRRASSRAEMLALIVAAEIDIAVVTSDSAGLSADLIDACDLGSVRLIAVVSTDGDRRHAHTLDFHETSRADASWLSMVELLRPPSFDGDPLPDLAFFDVAAPRAGNSALSPGVRLAASPARSDVSATGENVSPAPASPSGKSGPGEAPECSVIAVWGPTGAPGRTSLAVNLAAELTVRGHRVLLVDADPYGGAIAARLGLLDETPGFAAVCRLADQELLTRSEFDRIAQRADVNGHELFVLSGILRPDRWPELSAARVTAAIETCQRFCDVMIIDVGFNLESDEEISSDLFSPRRNTATLSAMAAATTLVTVADSDVVGLARFLRSSAEVAKLFPGARLLTVANKVRSSVAGFAPGTQVRQTLERFGGLVDIALVPHDDKAFDACSLRAAPLCLVAPKSAARRAIVELALKCAAPATRSVAAKTRGFRSRRSAQHPD